MRLSWNAVPAAIAVMRIAQSYQVAKRAAIPQRTGSQSGTSPQWTALVEVVVAAAALRPSLPLRRAPQAVPLLPKTIRKTIRPPLPHQDLLHPPATVPPHLATTLLKRLHHHLPLSVPRQIILLQGAAPVLSL